MKSRDLYLSMIGIDDDILEKANRFSNRKKVSVFHRLLPVVACICCVLFTTVTAAAAIHHFWGRGMSGFLKSTDTQQQVLTDKGQAIVYKELTDYSTYKITDNGITISPDTVVADENFVYASFKVIGLDIDDYKEPGADVDYYLGDDKNSLVNGSSSFYDGTMIDDNGMAVYDDGTAITPDENGNFGHYKDKNGDLEYVIQIQAGDGLNSVLGSTLHVDFSSLGIYTGKAEFTPSVKGKWNFDLKLPKVSSSQTITVNKEVPNSNCSITTVEISPVSITVNYKVDGKLKETEDGTGIPEFIGFVLKDGTRLPFVANGGSSGFKDESRKEAVCIRGYDRVIDISKVKSLLLWPNDYGGCDKVEVKIQ